MTLSAFWRNQVRLGAAALAGYAAARAAEKLLSRRSASSWQRTAKDGRSVSLREGPVAVAGTTAGCAAGALLSGGSCSAGPVIAALSGGLAGYIDDFYESAFSRTSKGLRGHLGALSRGHLTSGALKIVIIGVGAALAGKLPADRGLPSSKRFALHAERTILIAATANLINLLDLAPGRAWKGTLIAAAPFSLVSYPPAGPVAAALVGTGAACLPEDLAGTVMLGDTGANALGAALGWALASRGPWVRRGALGAVVALNIASEKISFSRVIATHPWLRALDQAGRA
ncbi:MULTISPECIES: hypothetical protein [Actinotignum]|uniref:Glycosyl transferase family 4 n=1 Tax=Actinotignum timonense TaxID=1870995 RepID=A0AAW9HKB2_9ACTO|nr:MULTISPECIES: hypothetical protein [Actinotignum]MDE1558408.1 hypothetical protein [Actinotignum schaalii]MDE1662970.1 hypothetical protein [Actinotignum schaalii]MDK6372883.1 hypothetical protein [Actinotignum timonense]MDK6418736.1 hypothetical protein [Actinotignum timonense]MDK6645494.1 hypothetical protein [Actinotignum timonense]